MSFKRFEADDLVVSAEPVSAPVWSTGTPILTTFFTSSTQPTSTSGNYYLDIYQTGSTLNGANVQFAIAYADASGLGTAPFNSAVSGKSPSSTVYGQYRTLVLGDEESSFIFGGVTSPYFYAITIDRDRYKESLLAGSFNLTLTNNGNTLKLTDNSVTTTTISFNDAGRVFQVVSGSNGTPYTGVNSNGYSIASGSYGYFLPDIGVILLNGVALDGSTAAGGIALGTNRGTTSLAATATNMAKMYDTIKAGATFQLNYRETISSQFVFTRVRNSEFNYSTNPSYITGSGDLRIANMVNAPQTYITTVGMYNDNNELLAVAKLSRPLLKDFTKEALIRIKLDF
jgi:hypothetical protein